MREFEVGTYRELDAVRKKFGTVDGLVFDLDHIPSKAALKAAFKEANGGRALNASQRDILEKDESVVISMRQKLHVDSRTYFDKNKPALILQDSANIPKAIRADLNTFIQNARTSGIPDPQIMHAVSQVVLRNRQLGYFK